LIVFSPHDSTLHFTCARSSLPSSQQQIAASSRPCRLR
jgi:hypothetical protein